MVRTLALLAAAEGGDVLTTWYGIAHGFREAQPTSAAVIAAMGLTFWAFWKSAPLVATVGVGSLIPAEWRAIFLRGVRVGALMLLGVVASNVLILAGR